MKIEDAMMGQQQLYLGDGEMQQMHGGINQPLGKLVNQLEMKDPEARRRLREVLDQQMKEKRAQDENIR